MLAAVTIEGTDLHIEPNVSGGNPNDSYMLKLIGDGDTGADRAMSLHNVPTTDANYRLAISDNGGTERFSFTAGGNFGIGDTTPSYLLDVNGDARIGHNGDSTRIKVLPNHFWTNNDKDKDGGYVVYEDDDTSKGVRMRYVDVELYAFVAIPMGFKATHVRIYGSSTDTVTVYESDIDDGNWGSSLGSAATGTEIDITDTNSTSTNFLVIEIAVNATSDDIYGGYVTIAPL